MTSPSAPLDIDKRLDEMFATDESFRSDNAQLFDTAVLKPKIKAEFTRLLKELKDQAVPFETGIVWLEGKKRFVNGIVRAVPVEVIDELIKELGGTK